MSSSRIAVISIVAVACLSGYLVADWYNGVDADATSQFVGRDQCASCHQDQLDLFHGSHHDLAMDRATDDSVLANFDNATIETFGIESRMFRDGDRFMINTEGPDGEMADFEVKYVFGVEPLQQYMVELDPPDETHRDGIGRVQVLRISWDTRGKKWFYLPPPDVDEKLAPDDPLHWTGVTQNWNVSCAECHSTDLRQNFDVATNRFHTTFSEIDVSCESCHGPASLHVDIARNKGIFWDRNHGFGLTATVKEQVQQVDACAACHSRRTQIAENFQAGCNFDDYFALQPLTPPIYFADGQIRDEDYVHGSFTQSKMYHAGIKCSDCHDPHSLKLLHDGNQTCTSCHQHPAGKYDSPSHHFHAVGTDGAKCVNCHMPSTTYMELDERRDHSFRVPRPDMSVSLGTPNACTKCHLEVELATAPPTDHAGRQYRDWVVAAGAGEAVARTRIEAIDRRMAEATLKWYPPETSPPKTAYYEDLAKIQTSILGPAETDQETDLVKSLATDRAIPALFRATAVTNLNGFEDSESLAIAISALDDSDPKVVSAAVPRIGAEINVLINAWMQSGNAAREKSRLSKMVANITRLLNHPSMPVRVQAARTLTEVPGELREQLFSVDTMESFRSGVLEYEQSLNIAAGRASAHLMLGSLNESMGRMPEAMQAYLDAIRIDPSMAGARTNLASLLEQTIRSLGNQADSTQVNKLQQRVKTLREQEHELLKRDVKLAESIEGSHRLMYQFAMSSYLQKDMAATEEYLLKAWQQQPESQTYLLALATMYVQLGDANNAMLFVDRLLALDPTNPQYAMLQQAAARLPQK